MKITLLLFFLVSCSHWFNPIVRTPYELKSQNGFIITNVYTDPLMLEHSGEDIILRYEIVVKNTLPQNRDIDLEKALVANKKQSVPMDCKTYERKERTFNIKSSETVRVQCEAKIQTLLHEYSDQKLVLSVPFEKDLILFSYNVRKEDLK